MKKVFVAGMVVGVLAVVALIIAMSFKALANPVYPMPPASVPGYVNDLGGFCKVAPGAKEMFEGLKAGYNANVCVLS